MKEILEKDLFSQAHVTFNVPKPDTEIWIADNVVIMCKMKYHWWNALFLRLIFGWKVKKI